MRIMGIRCRPNGPLFDVGFFRDFGPGGETGLQLWYGADDNWKPVIHDPGFDIEHPVSYHFLGVRRASRGRLRRRGGIGIRRVSRSS